MVVVVSPLGAVVVRRVVVVLEVDDCAAGAWAQVAPVRTKAISKANNVFMSPSYAGAHSWTPLAEPEMPADILRKDA